MATNPIREPITEINLRVRVVRAFPDGRFETEYEGLCRGNRVDARLLTERMQSEFDLNCEPLRAYIVRAGVPIEAAFCLREARG